MPGRNCYKHRKIAMRATAEVRWFYEGPIPAAVDAWFRHFEPEPHAQPPRTDGYLYPTGAALNVKVREGRLEMKRRDAMGDAVVFNPRIEGYVEHWRKWSFALASGEAAEVFGRADPLWIDVRKTRRMRSYRLDEAGRVTPVSAAAASPSGCAVELAHVEAAGRRWWSLCFEAYGDDAPLADLLVHTARHVFAHGDPPALDLGHSAGYAGWLLGSVKRET